MAHVYIGNNQSIDMEMLKKVQELDDTFWVFGGVKMGREVDWLVIGTSPLNSFSPLIVTQIKRFDKAIRGNGQDAVWECQDDEGNWYPIEADHPDRNPYWQAVHTANAIKTWLWNQQSLFLSKRPVVLPEDAFGVWPLLLILSPKDVHHLLPIGPTSRYGAWLYSEERWLAMLRSWHPRKGVLFTDADMQRLVKLLGLTKVIDDRQDYEIEEVEIEDEEEVDLETRVYDLENEVDELRERLERLERQ